MSSIGMSPVRGKLFVYPHPRSITRCGNHLPNGVCTVAAVGEGTTTPVGATVIVDFTSFDSRPIQINGVNLRIIPEDAVLCQVGWRSMA